MAAASGYLLLAVLCTISIVKSRLCSRQSCYKACTKREKCFCGYLCGYQRPFLVNHFHKLLPFHVCKNDTATSEKYIPAGFCKLNRRWNLSQENSVTLVSTDKEVHKAFYRKYNGIFHACANSVQQASPRLGTRLVLK